MSPERTFIDTEDCVQQPRGEGVRLGARRLEADICPWLGLLPGRGFVPAEEGVSPRLVDQLAMEILELGLHRLVDLVDLEDWSRFLSQTVFCSDQRTRKLADLV